MRDQRIQIPVNIQTSAWQKATPEQERLSEGNAALAAQQDPVTQVMCRLGDKSCAQAHVATLNRATTGQQKWTPASLLRLQRDYGNRYVNQVVALGQAASIIPKRGCECGLESAEDGREVQHPSRGSCGLEDDEEIERKAGEAARVMPMSPRPEDLPQNNDATIKCNGQGGYRVSLGAWAGKPCGITGCVTRHEESHIADWQGRWPNGCKNADGTPKPDGSQIPLGGDGYAAFLRQSECRAYGVEERCTTDLLAQAPQACQTALQDHLADTRAQKNSFC